MTVLSSQQVAVRPFQLETQATLTSLAAEMRKAKFNAVDSASTGWGSVNDDDSQLRLPPTNPFPVGSPSVLPPGNGLPERLRARYYWMHRDSAGVRRHGTTGNWQLTTTYAAADVLIWKDGPNLYSGLVTDRPEFAHVTRALQKASAGLADRVALTTDLIPQRLDEDFFLWLLYRARSASRLSPAVFLSGITQISSADRRNRSIDVKGGATLDRVELAAAIALGVSGFGPAKFAFDFQSLDAHFSIELHPDGGFQAYKSSSYDDDTKQKLTDTNWLIVIEDLWITALPALRSLYADDSAWHVDGPSRFRAEARNEVKILLKI